MSASSSFALAKMSPVIVAFTGFALSIPVIFAAVAVAGAGPVVPIMATTAVGLVLLYAGVWIWYRPRAFEVTDREVRIVWPGRTRTIERSDVTRARIITRDEFRTEFGWGMRIGVGGLWGAFGWLWTANQGLVDCYVSRLDGLVLLERREHRSLLVTPERADDFVGAIGPPTT